MWHVAPMQAIGHIVVHPADLSPIIIISRRGQCHTGSRAASSCTLPTTALVQANALSGCTEYFWVEARSTAPVHRVCPEESMLVVKVRFLSGFDRTRANGIALQAQEPIANNLPSLAMPAYVL